ncbi:MAG: SDR family NAD(P)-dependent oxidoreductase [Candidatus Binatia bacterium]
MGNRLQGKVAIVTGAGRGLGRAEALALAAEGAKVVVNDLGGNPDGTGDDKSPADQVVAEIKAAGSDAVANYASVTRMEGGQRMVQQALDAFGRLDILVNNAGILRNRMVFNMSEEEWDAVIAVHLKGHFTVTRFATQVFRQQRSGRIVNTSSEAGIGTVGGANYGAAKEGITGLTRSLSYELGRYGITVNAIRPRAATRLVGEVDIAGTVDRGRTGAAFVPDFMREIGDMNARREQFSPELVAPLVVYLCTDAASNVNGRDFIVGGGEISLVSLPKKERTIYTEHKWTVDQLEELFPRTLGAGLKNPARS